MTVNNIGKTFSDGTVQGTYPYRNRENQKFDESLLSGPAVGNRDGIKENPVGSQRTDRKRIDGYQIEAGRCVGEIAAANMKILTEKRGEERAAVRECEVRHISCAESDFSKVCAVEGYSLKAKAFLEEGKVYLEQKSEDGSIRAYEADVKQIREETRDVLEQAALMAWRKAKENGRTEQTDFREAMLAFYEKVEKQIKNGPPEFQTGGAEFGEEEWKKLIEELDTCLEEVRREDAVSSELIEKLLEDRDTES